MKTLKILFIFCTFKFLAAKSVSKCPDFKTLDDSDSLECFGRWNVVRIYGFPSAPEDKKVSCVVVNVYATDKEDERKIESIMTTKDGEINNNTAIGVRIAPGVLDAEQDRTFEHSGIKMKVHIHAKVKLKQGINLKIFFKFFLSALSPLQRR